MAGAGGGAILVNGRFRRQRTTGVQRVAEELTQRLATPHEVAVPAGPASGAKGHLWEQFTLPRLTNGRTLWSPCNTGPLLVENQVVTIHDAAVFDHPEWFSPAFTRTYRLLLPLLAKRVRRIVTVSDFSRRALAPALGIPEARIEVVTNGVDPRFRPAPPGAAPPLPEALRGRRYFATLSTLEPRKNLALTIAAWQLARPRLPSDFVLLVIGGAGSAAVFGAAGPAAANTADDCIAYTGFAPDADLPGLLSGATALLYPSLYEGFGLPALEAMACGTPVVTTALTSLPEVCGDAALYVDAHDPRQMADTLVALASDPALQADHAGRGMARAGLFTWPAAAAKMDAIFAAIG